MSNILVTGAFGQIGTELVPALQNKYGHDHVIAVGHKNLPSDFKGIVETCDTQNFSELAALVDKYQVTQIYHLVSLLSAKGEINPAVTWDVNINGLLHVLNLAKDKQIKVFWPSSIAAFGATTPRQQTPQQTILEPTTMYGVTKVSGELLCQYFHLKFGVDVRSVRYPGIISWKAEPGGGTTDYAVAIFYKALQTGNYSCYLKPNTILPMMYYPDAIRATLEIMEAPSEKIKVRTSYNLAAISFSAQELIDTVNQHVPVAVTFEPDHRQAIADSWPQSIDDSQARQDWGWQHTYDLEKMVVDMIINLKKKLGA